MKIYKQILVVLKANERDNLKDEDGDNIADVDEISAAELIQRKSLLVLAAVNPAEINKAMQSLYTANVAVVGVLKLQFAKTVALGNAIGDILMTPVMKFVKPPLMKIFPEEYAAWCPVILSWIVKSIAISIAWSLQRIISAFHSSIRGGLMAARALINYLNS